MMDVTATGGFVVLAKPGERPHLAMKPAKARLVAQECAVATGLAIALGCQPDYRLDQTISYAEHLVEFADAADGQVVDLSLGKQLGAIG